MNVKGNHVRINFGVEVVVIVSIILKVLIFAIKAVEEPVEMVRDVKLLFVKVVDSRKIKLVV